jgi:hypothetical protein
VQEHEERSAQPVDEGKTKAWFWHFSKSPMGTCLPSPSHTTETPVAAVEPHHPHPNSRNHRPKTAMRKRAQKPH